LNEPSGVAVTAASQIVVADYWNGRIEVFDRHGGFARTFPVTAWQAGSYDEPQIAVDRLSRVLVPDPVGGNILVYKISGEPLDAWGNGASNTVQLTEPLFAAAGPAGAVVVGDPGSNTVTRFSVP
jgi:DNA-binding beta-propeller fold protein YncE